MTAICRHENLRMIYYTIIVFAKNGESVTIMEISQQIYEEINKRKSGFNGLVGIVIEEFGVGTSTLSLEVTEKHLNPAGTLHGGVVCTMLDTSAGISGMSKEDGVRPLVTTSADVHFLKPISKGRITAKGTLVKDGRYIAVARSDLYTEQGVLAATGTFEFFYTDKGNGIATEMEEKSVE